MTRKWFAAGCLVAAGVLAWAASSRAGDTVRLNLVDNTPTQNLVDDGSGASTVQTWWRGGYRGFYGGYRGFYGGYRGFYGGYRGFYRPFYYGGFYRPYYYGGFYRPFYGIGLGYGGYYPSFGYGFGGYSGYGFGPCSGLTAGLYTAVLPPTSLSAPTPAAQYPPADAAPRSDGTYPYDGGPKGAPSVPGTSPAPTSAPQRTVPLEGRSVSLPKPATKWAYPAFGETARRTSFAEDRTLLAKDEPKNSGRR